MIKPTSLHLQDIFNDMNTMLVNGKTAEEVHAHLNARFGEKDALYITYLFTHPIA